MTPLAAIGVSIAIAVGVGSLVLLGQGVFDQKNDRQQREFALIKSGLSPSVVPILNQSCADCHSNLVHRPWYAKMPVVSKLIDDDVLSGRQFMDLTKWSGYTRGRKLGYLAAIQYSIGAGHMPPARYWLIHPYARLSRQEADSVRDWAAREIRGLRPPRVTGHAN